jgi:hypothetical protein
VRPIDGAQWARTGISAAVTDKATRNARKICTPHLCFCRRLAFRYDSLVKNSNFAASSHKHPGAEVKGPLACSPLGRARVDGCS